MTGPTPEMLMLMKRKAAIDPTLFERYVEKEVFAKTTAGEGVFSAILAENGLDFVRFTGVQYYCRVRCSCPEGLLEVLENKDDSRFHSTRLDQLTVNKRYGIEFIVGVDEVVKQNDKN